MAQIIADLLGVHWVFKAALFSKAWRDCSWSRRVLALTTAIQFGKADAQMFFNTISLTTHSMLVAPEPRMPSVLFSPVVLNARAYSVFFRL